MKKRTVALLTVLVLILTVFGSAMAAKPTAVLTKAPTAITRGKIASFIFKLDSKSYAAKSDTLRAKLETIVAKGSQQTGSASWVWTGTQSYVLRVGMKKAAPAGTYKLIYRVYYRKNASGKWIKASGKSYKFTAK